jgi:hypothetical protein
LINVNLEEQGLTRLGFCGKIFLSSAMTEGGFMFVLMGDTGDRESSNRYFEDDTAMGIAEVDRIEFPIEGPIGEKLQVQCRDGSWRTVLERKLAKEGDVLLPGYAKGTVHEIPPKMMKPGPWVRYGAGSPLVAVSFKDGVARVFARSCSALAARAFSLIPPGFESATA